MFNFALELAEESLADALQSGNLHGEKSRTQRQLKNPDTRIAGTGWISTGYFASIHYITCRNCNNIKTTLHGVFHEEKLSSGTTRLQMLSTFQIPKDSIQPTRFSNFKTDACIKCVEAFGFSLAPPK